jgi:tetratricopeptide (TPR) repeat protein
MTNVVCRIVRLSVSRVLPALLAWSAVSHAAAPSLLQQRRWPAGVRADSLSLAGQVDAAVALVAPLLREARAHRDAGFELRLVIARGAFQARAGRAKQAEPDLRAGLALAAAQRDTARLCAALRWLAVALQGQGRLDEAGAFSERLLALALARGDPENEGYARTGRAYRELMVGDAEAAREGYERAAGIFRQLGNPRMELIALTGLGRAYDRLGDRQRARASMLRIEARAREVGDRSAEAHALNNLGAWEFLEGDPGAAVRYYRKAYELHRAAGNPNDALTPAHNIAVAQTYLGQYEDAAAILTEALATCERYGYRDQQASVLNQLGLVRDQQGRPREAAALFRRGLALGGSVPPEVGARLMLGLTQSLIATDSAAAALRLFEGPVEGLRPRLSPDGRVEMDRAHGGCLLQLGRPRDALRFVARADREAVRADRKRYRMGNLATMAACYRGMGRPDSALAVLRRAAEAWEEQRGLPRDPEWREQRTALAGQLYADLAALMLEYPPGRPRERRVHETFDALQTFKARTLHERMLGPAGALATGPAGPGRPPVTLERLQRHVLAPGELLLDTFLGRDTSFVFAVTRQECRVVRLPGALGGLGAKLRLYHDLASTPPPSVPSRDPIEAAEEGGRGLGAQLLGPISDLVARSRRVIVAPDGWLNLVPFGALSVPAVADRGADPLLAGREVVAVPSATVLAELRGRARSPGSAGAGRKLLALAGSTGPRGVALAGAAHEVRLLGRRYTGVDVRAEGAPPPKLDELSGYEVLHVAAHTAVDDQHPWRSGILLAPAGESGSARYLRASQIAGLDLPARLAVLSGCESAGGRILSGEGVLGLTGAFVSAGVPAVIATLWPVEDRATARLMEAFYAALARGETVAAALRKAQLAVRRNPRTRHPFFWAGFVLVGEGDIRVNLKPRLGL